MISMRIAGLYASDGSCKFLPYQLRMVGYWPTMALTGLDLFSNFKWVRSSGYLGELLG